MPIIILLFFIIKFFIYSSWAYYGLNYFKLHFERPYLIATGTGLFRLLIGIIVGLIIGLIWVYLFSHLYLDETNLKRIAGIIGYFLFLYLPSQWLVWLITYKVMTSKKDIMIDPAMKNRWILGGIIISTLLDWPVILFTGLMMGVC